MVAVTQQAVAYVAVVGAEAAFTGLTKSKPDGKPGILQTLSGVAGVLGVSATQSHKLQLQQLFPREPLGWGAWLPIQCIPY